MDIESLILNLFVFKIKVNSMTTDARCEISYLREPERAELTLVGLLSGMDSKMFRQS